MLSFSTLKASDANAINKITAQLPPYSDFNFTSLYSWSLHSQTKFCIYNDCLFLILPDYVTQKPRYSFICKDNFGENFMLFVRWLRANSLPQTFHLLPEIVTKGLIPYLRENNIIHELASERDSYDYVLDTHAISQAKGKQYSDLRYKVSLFNRKWGDKVRQFQFLPHEKDHQIMAVQLAKRWSVHKQQKSNHVYQDEIDAFCRFLQVSSYNPQIFFKAFADEDHLVGLASYERVSDKYGLGHFLKFDYSHTGIFQSMLKEVCSELSSTRIGLLNIEQDLGIEGLRKAKTQLKPAFFLKKFTLRII